VYITNFTTSALLYIHYQKLRQSFIV